MDVSSTAATTITIFERLEKLFQIIKDIKDLPNAIQRVGESFPIVLDVVKIARDEPNNTEFSGSGYVMGFLKICNTQAKGIGYTFNAIKNAMEHRSEDRNWSTFVDIYREKVRKAGKVEALMEQILQKLRNLAVRNIFKSHAEALPAIERMTEAIKAINDAEPPLTDSDINDSAAT
ncbi:ankyrin repeat protein [Colletotrichum camelliae]|nr:ankyrin repeat protein [Colletotrichum camelliae]